MSNKDAHNVDMRSIGIIDPPIKSNIPRPTNKSVGSTEPDIGIALPDAPFSAPVDTMKASVAVSVFPVAGFCVATTMVCAPSVRICGTAYVQLPFASVVTVAVICWVEYTAIVTVLPAGAVPSITGCDVEIEALLTGDEIVTEDEVALLVPVGVGVSE